MKTKLFYVFVFLLMSFVVGNSMVIRTQVRFNPNNIDSWIQSTGIFNQDIRTNNTPGFMWPTGSDRFAIFTTGLSIGAYINGQMRLASCSYNGEYTPGRILSGIPTTDSNTFKIYKVTRGDGPSNPDWVNWYKMVPFGAPFVDVNNNGVFDSNIDTPGVKNAQQTVFICLTDGFPESHFLSEGFSGGTDPLFSEMHFTAWGYSNTVYSDMQFVKFDIINKGTYAWNQVFMGIVADPDLGNGNDDYIGCDTARQLGFCYNSLNYDGNGNPPSYGLNPPSVGMILLKGCADNSVNPPLNFRMTSFNYFTNNTSGGLTCEQDPSIPTEAYEYLKGNKKDGSPFMDPFVTPHKQTKFCYPGDPETAEGWTEYRGSVQNCGGPTGNTITANPSGDRRFIIGTGNNDFNINPGDTQKIVICQLIARGTNNWNSVTKLKQLSDIAWNLYNAGFITGVQNISTIVPEKFSLSQNYPNPFNPVTKIKFSIPENGKLNIGNGNVTMKVFDMLGKEIATIVNERLNPGTYEVTFDGSKYSSGVYFYRLNAGSFTETKKMILLK
ncbi:MAG: T9SS type A sorting domain-containing protein [Ignavibacteria bacterium]|nr:T9SS type A sorting domain-containing protein [Ignavibacteria bacterium]